jgi:hypothetical protein
MDLVTICAIVFCISTLIIGIIGIWIVLTEDKRLPKYKIKKIVHGEKTAYYIFRKRNIFYENAGETRTLEGAIEYIEQNKRSIKEEIEKHKNDKEEWMSNEEIFKERL